MKKRFNLSRMFKLREKIFLALKPFIDANISGQTLKDLFEDILKALPASTPADPLFESVRALAGTTLTRREALEFAGRIAGNIDRLLAGFPIVPWTRQIKDEWVPVQIVQVDAARRGHRDGYIFRCRALAGTPCGMLFEQFLSRGSCSAIAHMAGFSRTMPYSTAAHFANLRIWVQIEAAKSAEMPHFQQVDCTASMRSHNKRLIAIRTRAVPCPRNFSHPCEHCELGYSDCPAAIFPLRLEKRLCPCCELEAYFDPARSTDVCMGCRHAGVEKKIAEA